MSSTGLPFVQRSRQGGKTYLYYRRDGQRWPLPGPEGSAAFLAEYDRLHAKFSPHGDAWDRHTVGGAILTYMESPDFRDLSNKSQWNYRRYLDDLRARIGKVLMADIDVQWVERLRDRLYQRPHYWNALRSRMALVARMYRKRNPKIMPINPWEEVDRLKTAVSDQNRRWPDDVLAAVMKEATPEFRALLTTLLLTSQRIGDVVQFTPRQYDRESRTLGYRDAFAQAKTDKELVFHVTDSLAKAFECMVNRAPGRLLCTPRGKAWTVLNAEETLLSLRNRLGLDRYTLHGLRRTSLSALKMEGLENRRIRALSGHDSDKNLEIYLRGVESYDMRREAQEILEARFAKVIEQTNQTGNRRRASGVTGKAAAKAGVYGASRDRGKENVSGFDAVKAVSNGKTKRDPI